MIYTKIFDAYSLVALETIINDFHLKLNYLSQEHAFEYSLLKVVHLGNDDVYKIAYVYDVPIEAIGVVMKLGKNLKRSA